MKNAIVLCLFALLFGWMGCTPDATVEVKHLRLEMKENPLGINAFFMAVGFG